MELLIILAGLALMGWFADHGHKLIQIWMKNRHKLAVEELRVRRLEALSRMEEPSRKLLLESLPDWLDPNDDAEVEAWKNARKEVVQGKRRS